MSKLGRLLLTDEQLAVVPECPVLDLNTPDRVAEFIIERYASGLSS